MKKGRFLVGILGVVMMLAGRGGGVMATEMKVPVSEMGPEILIKAIDFKNNTLTVRYDNWSGSGMNVRLLNIVYGELESEADLLNIAEARGGWRQTVYNRSAMSAGWTLPSGGEVTLTSDPTGFTDEKRAQQGYQYLEKTLSENPYGILYFSATMSGTNAWDHWHGMSDYRRCSKLGVAEECRAKYDGEGKVVLDNKGRVVYEGYVGGALLTVSEERRAEIEAEIEAEDVVQSAKWAERAARLAEQQRLAEIEWEKQMCAEAFSRGETLEEER